MAKVEFNKEKISTSFNFSDILLGTDIIVGKLAEDHIKNTLTAKLESYVLSNMVEQRKLTYYCERPKFFDWLFRRRKTVKFDLDVRDLMLNPPKLENTVRFYEVTQTTN